MLREACEGIVIYCSLSVQTWEENSEGMLVLKESQSGSISCLHSSGSYLKCVSIKGSGTTTGL